MPRKVIAVIINPVINISDVNLGLSPVGFVYNEYNELEQILQLPAG